jgi:hypothetical protein
MSKELKQYVRLLKIEGVLTADNKMHLDIYRIVTKRMEELLDKMTTEDYIELCLIIHSDNND